MNPRDEDSNEDKLADARAMFDRMSDEARSTIEREQREPRTPLVRILLLLTIAACLAAAVTGFYGVYNFPDAPIRQSNIGYVGKTGKPHTRDEFEGYVAWEKTMFIAFPAAFVFGISYAIASAVQRKRSQNPLSGSDRAVTQARRKS